MTLVGLRMAHNVNTLSERQRRFVDAFMGPAAGIGSKAATAAGYSQKTAPQIAARLLRKAHIQQAIQQRQEEDPRVADRRQRQAFWTAAMENPELEMRDRLRASELLGRSQGDFLERVEHRGTTLEELIVASRTLGDGCERSA